MNSRSKSNMEENLARKMILENLKREVELRKYNLTGIIFLLLILKLVFKTFPYFYPIAIFLIFIFSLLFPLANYIKSHPSLNLRKLRFFLSGILVLELLAICGVFYVFIPIKFYYLMPIALLAFPFFVIYLIFAYPLLYSKRYNDFFYLLCFLLLVLLIFLENKGFYPSYPNYPILQYKIRSSQVAFIAIAIGGFIFFVLRNNLLYFWGKFSKLNFEPSKLNKELEEKVEKRTREIREKLKQLEKTEEERTITLIRERASKRDAERKAKELEKMRIALINILEDVEKERDKAEQEKNKTLTIIQNFADGLLFFDKENNLSLINPKAEDFLKVEPERFLGKSILELRKFPNFKPLVDLLGKEIKKVFRKELKLRENLILEISAIPVMREKEKLGSLVILHDITREKMIERMKTEFVSIAAHQLRTPLSAIKWTLRMFLDGDLGKITKEQREFLEKTYKSNERMIKLVNDLLNVTRIEEGRYLYKPVFARMEDIVQSVIDSLKKEIERKKLNFEFKILKKKLPKVKMDVEKMRLAIENLIGNAIRYTPPKGKVMASLDFNGKEINFKVKDTGIGIPKEEQKRVFSKFFRAANAIKMETEGSGLGLYITKNIIEAHGGKIWFKSEEGKGTTFYFTIPVKKKF